MAALGNMEPQQEDLQDLVGLLGREEDAKNND